MERAARQCNAGSAVELASYVAARLGESQHVVDAIWTYGKDGFLERPNRANLSRVRCVSVEGASFPFEA